MSPRIAIDLTDRQLQSLVLSSEGLTATEIAHLFGTTTSAVSTCLHRVYRKLGATCGAHAVRIALESGLIPTPEIVALRAELGRVYRALAAANAELSRRPAQPAPVAMDHQFGVHLLSYREVA